MQYYTPLRVGNAQMLLIVVVHHVYLGELCRTVISVSDGLSTVKLDEGRATAGIGESSLLIPNQETKIRKMEKHLISPGYSIHHKAA
jgi:hypothetical protein